MHLSRIPPREYGVELLDDPSVDESLVLRTVTDISRSNSILLGARAVVREVESHLDRVDRNVSLLDVGTGVGDIPRAIQRHAPRHSLYTVGVEIQQILARRARTVLSEVVIANGMCLPFATRSIDVVVCSQTLHHFRGDEASTLIRELDRVARVAVILSDLRRSWVALGGFWAISFPFRFHPVMRRDGLVSIRRAFTPQELGDTIQEALGFRPRVNARLGYRLTTSWTPTGLIA